MNSLAYLQEKKTELMDEIIELQDKRNGLESTMTSPAGYQACSELIDGVIDIRVSRLEQIQERIDSLS